MHWFSETEIKRQREGGIGDEEEKETEPNFINYRHNGKMCDALPVEHNFWGFSKMLSYAHWGKLIKESK